MISSIFVVSLPVVKVGVTRRGLAQPALACMDQLAAI